MNQLIVLTALFGLTFLPGLARAEFVQAKLTGFQEVPSVSTVARGEFRAKINKDEDSINYELTYEGLQGTITQAHIHFAQRGVNGSIVIWLCTTDAVTTAPTGTQICPASPGTITGTITAANVVAASMAAQQISAGELAEVIAAMLAGKTYANVHTSLSGSGEIRGQIREVRKGKDRGRDKDRDKDLDKDHHRR
jgi:hypothetical protein